MRLTSKSIDYTVATVADFPTTGLADNQVVVVTENGRGGTFAYDSTRALENDGGTVFNGWCRQYDGHTTPQMFGMLNDYTFLKHCYIFSLYLDTLLKKGQQEAPLHLSQVVSYYSFSTFWLLIYSIN